MSFEIFLCVVMLISVIVVSSFTSIIVRTRNERIEIEHKLETTRNSMKEVLEKVIKNNDINAAKITYVAYFGQVSDPNADGMF